MTEKIKNKNLLAKKEIKHNKVDIIDYIYIEKLEFRVEKSNINEEDLDLIYSVLMNDDIECSFQHGMYHDICEDVSYIDVDDILEFHHERVQDLKDDNETFANYHRGEVYLELIERLKQWRGYNIFNKEWIKPEVELK